MNILQLSDIHFRKSEVLSAQDPNFGLRNELLRDVRDRRTKHGSADVIILSGDIAFAGDAQEFMFARSWLEQLCEAAGSELKAIFVVPGNHDVVRKIADSKMVQLLHEDIKAKSGSSLDSAVADHLIDPDSARLLYLSLENYNAFAQQFLCDLLPPNRTRTTRDIPLNDGSTLRLWGLNTAFVSSSKDVENDLFVDTASLQITREAGIANLVIAHHHPSWLRQRQALEDNLGAVAPIQLFGHVHTNRVMQALSWVRFTASAVHPDRFEQGWEPGYNWLEVDVFEESSQRKLRARGHIRVWQNGPNQFRPKMDGPRDYFESVIALEAWQAPTQRSPGTVSVRTDDHQTAISVDAMTTLREIGIKFYQLTFSQKFEIAGRLGLLEADDTIQPDFERFRRVFIRAQERGKLEELMKAIDEMEGGTD
jgi:hypothetical protein